TVGGSHVYADNAIYPIKVTVTDSESAAGDGSSSSKISNANPDLDANFTIAAPTTAGKSFKANVTASFTDPCFTSALAQTAETFTATIDWGDGQTETVSSQVTQGSAGVATSGTFSPSHEYTNPGQYTVKVKVTDDDTGSDEVTLQVTGGNAN